ncbi:hypothetical protein F511_07808 [Dorcoceras hygrometricum]|uniref:KxDL domain-containing protein n=1 Tax=Dorcoceras hygrometricum TaxID=472368 RepID=A0A2Z7CRV1_9LAMI|nr:hypothetical protein F511_07808 [Dorcoceras hygrometricum]
MANAGSVSTRTASEEISKSFRTLIDSQDLDSLKHSQHLILGRLQDSNAVLSHFNEYSENCLSDVSAEFSKNTRLLRSMKSDLDYIFLKLSFIMCLMSPTIIFSLFSTVLEWEFARIMKKDGFLLGFEMSTLALTCELSVLTE